MNLEVFTQAQSRGWMEGWEYMGHEDLMETGQPVERFRSLNPIIAPRLLSLNDILFGTDFCEKYFEEARDKCVYCDNYASTKVHQTEMLYMSESDRIEFLEKHLFDKKDEELGLDTEVEKEIFEEIQYCQHYNVIRKHEIWSCDGCGKETRTVDSSFESDRRIKQLGKALMTHIQECKL